MKKYVIDNVMDYRGNIKPERMGRIVTVSQLVIDRKAVLEYVDGGPHVAMVSSTVVSYDDRYLDNGHVIVIKTLNSIYTLKEVEDE